MFHGEPKLDAVTLEELPELFEWLMWEQGLVFYIPNLWVKPFESGEWDAVVFGTEYGLNIRNFADVHFRASPLWGTLKRIEEGELHLLRPQLTVPARWAELRRRSYRGSGPWIVALRDGSVTELEVWCVCAGRRLLDGSVGVKETSGRLVTIDRRYNPSRARKIRRQVIDHYRKISLVEAIAEARRVGILAV